MVIFPFNRDMFIRAFGLWCMAALALGCGDGARSQQDATSIDALCAASNTECPEAEPLCTPPEYSKECSSDACAAPYECVAYDDPSVGQRNVCLEACDDACDCPAACVCKGVSGGASWGPDGFCICV